MRMKPRRTLDVSYSMVLMEEQQRSNFSTNSKSTTALVVRHGIKKDHYNKGKGSSEQQHKKE